MEKRHQVTNLEKYEENKKNCNIFKYFDIAILALEVISLSFELSVPVKKIQDLIVIALNSLLLPINSSILIETIVEKNKWQQKIEELKEQEENQSRSR